MSSPYEAPKSESVAEPLQICRHCGAEVPLSAPQCWLCFGKLPAGMDVVDAEVVAPPESPAWQLTEVFFAVVSALTALLVVLVGIGVFCEEPVMGIIYVVIVLPPLGVTVARTARKRRAGENISWAERFATFVVSSVVMLGFLGLLAVAAVACLIIMCFMNPPSFH